MLKVDTTLYSWDVVLCVVSCLEKCMIVNYRDVEEIMYIMQEQLGFTVRGEKLTFFTFDKVHHCCRVKDGLNIGRGIQFYNIDSTTDIMDNPVPFSVKEIGKARLAKMDKDEVSKITNLVKKAFLLYGYSNK